MKLNYISLTAKTALGAVVVAMTASMYAQSNQVSHVEYDLPHFTSYSIQGAMQARSESVAANDGISTLKAAGLPTFEQRPASIMRSAEAPRGNFYAAVNRTPTMETADDAYVGTLDLTSGVLKPTFHCRLLSKMGDDYSMQSIAYRKGELVIPQYMSDYTGGGAYVRWTTMDLNTGVVTGTHNFTLSLADPYAMTYDPDKDLFYLISFDNGSGATSMFGIVNPNGANGWEYIAGPKLGDTSGNNQPYIPAIAYNPVDKQIYAFDNHYGVYTIEYELHPSGKLIEDAYLIEVGETSVEELDNPCIFDGDPSSGIFNGAIAYSPMDQMFVAIYRDNFIQAHRILYLHPETFEGFVGKTLRPGDHFINGVICIDPVADADAPEMAAMPTANFDKQSLTGSIKIQTPKMSFVGVDISGESLECVSVIDGNQVDKRTVKAGDSFELPVTLAQGQHLLEFTTAIGDKVSPVRTFAFYVGYDAPTAPKNVVLSGDQLSWNANGSDGFHQGYVDMADLGYNIYLDGELQNTTPVKTTTFTLTPPELMKRYVIEVAAISQGQESPKTAINPIYGQAFKLPFSQIPTREEVECFDIYNENDDTAIFKYAIRNDHYSGLMFSCGYFNDADDWMVLPKIHFDSTEALYELRFTMLGNNADYTNESYEIYLAKNPEPKNLLKGVEIYSTPEEKIHGLIPSDKSFTFAVAEPGDYYIGIHVTSTRAQSSLGIFFTDFNVRELEEANSSVPGKLTDVKIVPAEFGEQAVVATVVLPTVDMLGRELPADDDITATLSFVDEGKAYEESATGKPGQTVTINHIAPNDGFVVYTLTPSNKNGKGFTNSYMVYVGIDTPLCPTNIQGVPTEDNMGVNLTWDAPGIVGANGGYVDFEAPDFKYTIYTRDGISLHKITDTKESEYTFYPYGEAKSGKLATFNVGPVAANIVGQSVGSMFVRDDYGTPYELPMKEEFNTAQFAYSPYTFFTSGAYGASTWENTSHPEYLGITGAQLIEGALIGYNESYVGLGKMNLPKFTTAGIKKSILILRYWDYAGAPKNIQIYARSSKNNEEVLASEIELRNPTRGEWVDKEIALPESLNDCSWVQLRIGTAFTSPAGQCLLIDSYTIMPDADFDLKISGLEGRTQVTIGDEAEYNVVVANSGRERLGGKLRMELLSPDGQVLASDEETIDNLNTSQTFEHTTKFNIGGECAKYKNLTVRATVDADDENLNNNSKQLVVNLMASALPVVTDLDANVNAEGNVELTWSPASSEYGNFENFESYEPFAVTETLDYWQNINADDLWPIQFQNQATGSIIRWKNDNKKLGWQVYDWNEMYNTTPDGTAYTTPANIERLKPHSGNQALLARSGGYAEDEEAKVTSKWLVSPKVKPNTQISFYYTTFASDYTEYIELWVCDKENGRLNPTDPNIKYYRAGDFKRVKSFSKKGSEIWELVTYSLSRTDRYFALRYVSYDGMAAAIDDLSFTPAEMLTRTPESYSVYRADRNGENAVCIADHITDTSFVDKDWKDSDAQYYVVAHSKVDEALRDGAISNIVFIASSSVGEVTVNGKVSTGEGVINVYNFGGAPVVIAATDGKVIVNGVVKSNAQSYAVERGIYLVTLGKKTYKVVVK